MSTTHLTRRGYLSGLAGLAGTHALSRMPANAAGISPASFLRLPERFQPDRALNSLPVKPNRRTTIATLEGPGCVRHIFVAIRPVLLANRNVILRIYFDGEEHPSVEAPLGDFFGQLHGIGYYPLMSLYVTAQHQAGYNCYFPMPFAKSARFELDAGPTPPPTIYFHIDWHRYAPGALQEDLRFHAVFRREFPAQAFREEYLILDAVGRGRLLGFFYGVRLYDETGRWSHGGAENIYIDGETTGQDGLTPSYIRGSGGEDTFGVAYGGVLHNPESHLYVGMPYYVFEDTGQALARHRVVGYRFYEQDAIPFEKSVQFRFGCVANDICSTAYWYQTEPHRPFVRMPGWAQVLPGVELKRGEVDLLRQTGSLDPNAPLADRDDGEWWLCGPFDNTKGAGLARKLPPDEGAKPDAAARYEGGFPKKSGWRNVVPGFEDQHMARWVRRRSNHGFIDFSHVFRPAGSSNALTWPAVAVAVTTLRVERDTEATIYLAWDDTMRLRLNDEPERDLGEQGAFRQRSASLHLRRGENRLQLKLSNEKNLSWGGWCFSCRVVPAGGGVLAPAV